MARPRSIPIEPEAEAPVVEVAEPKGMAYGIINDQGKNQILLERAARLEAEHYNHSLNLKIAESAPKGTQRDQAVAQAKAAMVELERQLVVITAEVVVMQDASKPE